MTAELLPTRTIEQLVEDNKLDAAKAAETPPLTVVPVPTPAKIAQAKCPKCGVFCRILEKEVDGVPPGNECPVCRWHSAAKNNPADLMSPSLLELIKSVPLNPVVRTQVHAITRVPIPDELQTFEQIQNWIRFQLPCLRPELGSFFEFTFPEVTAFHINVSATEETYGHCSYRMTSRGTGQISITTAMLNRAVEQALAQQAGTDTVARMLNDEINDIVCGGDDCPFDLEVQDEDHDDHEENGSNGRTMSLSRADLKAYVRDWIYNHNPDTLLRLDGGERL